MEASNHLAQSIIVETQIVERLVEILDECSMLMNDCFKKTTLFERAKANAFEDFLGKSVKNLSFAELIGTYTDKILRKGGQKTMNEQE